MKIIELINYMNSHIIYYPKTGLFFWKKKIGRCQLKNPAGTVMTNRYIIIGIKGKKFLAHRLAWLISTGSFPEDQIDHINGNRSDNRLSNLREATNLENSRNRHPGKRNKSGFVGVNFDKARGKWRADITINGRSKALGRFDDINDAIKIREINLKKIL